MPSYEILEQLIGIDSPSGFTEKACEFVREVLTSYGLSPELSNKGAVKCALGDAPRLAVAAHVDTLGAMVSNIQDDGSLRISPLGGLSLNMAEGEYVTVRTMSGGELTGTFLLDNPSVHANKEVSSLRRETKNMHVRLDEEVRSEDDVRSLGVRPGDIVCFDTRYQELPSGFIKSRFLDNKAGCYVLFEVARRLAEAGTRVPVQLFFSNYEEVGHGGTCGYASSVEELLVIDMGVLGQGCAGSETHCSICAKDTSGPYDWRMRSKLVELAETNEIPHVIDVYPYYGSDGSAALRAGNDFRVGLIGPGVAASHGVERTHTKAIEATIDLTLAYISATAS
jgi:putative aminopeptidase FrvX